MIVKKYISPHNYDLYSGDVDKLISFFDETDDDSVKKINIQKLSNQIVYFRKFFWIFIKKSRW